MKIKKGDTAIMLFHCAGVVSEEEQEVLAVHKDNTITLLTDDDARKCKRFSLKDGSCLNDTTDFGCWRTLKLK